MANDPDASSVLLDLLDLEEIELNHYRATSPSEGWERVYGGQVLGQALVAASRTVDEDRPAHSLHGYFLRGGDTTIPILYKVDRIRDGKSFTTRRVVAVQRGKAIFSMSISFQVREDGLTHQFPMPDAPDPDSLPADEAVHEQEFQSAIDANPDPAERAKLKEFAANFYKSRPIEFRSVTPQKLLEPESRAPAQLCWMKARDPLPDNDQLHKCVLAYLSDWSLLDTATLPHGISYLNDQMQMASLDHAMWFHRPFRADEWLLYAQDSPSASGARGMNRGLIYNRQGQLVASTAQEGLMRVHSSG